MSVLQSQKHLQRCSAMPNVATWRWSDAWSLKCAQTSEEMLSKGGVMPWVLQLPGIQLVFLQMLFYWPVADCMAVARELSLCNLPHKPRLAPKGASGFCVLTN